MTPSTDPPPSPLRPNLRQQWQLRPDLTFLNHGSFGALPQAVFDAQTQWRRRLEADPIELIGRRHDRLLAEAKVAVGQRLGMRPDDFGFVTNATDGINAVLRSIPLRPGDELLTTNHVYHAVRQTMKLVARQAGATCREVDIPLPAMSAADLAARVVAALGPTTRLVVIDHVTSPTALVFPVAEIIAGCRSRGVDVLVDGAHVAAMLPLDVERLGAAYYAGNLHKWALAPKGTAFLWVDPSHQSRVHPTTISHNLDAGFAREFDWQGTRDLSAWLTAPTSIAFLNDLGWDAVLDHNHRLAAWAHRLLLTRWQVEPVSPVDGSLLGSMATVRLPGRLAGLNAAELGTLQQRLHDEFRIEVPLVGWPGAVMLRVSGAVYNRPEEYDRLADVILGLAETGEYNHHNG